MLQLATEADNCQSSHQLIKLLKPSNMRRIRPPRFPVIHRIICLFWSKNLIYKDARSALDVDSTKL